MMTPFANGLQQLIFLGQGPQHRSRFLENGMIGLSAPIFLKPMDNGVFL